MIFKLVCFVGVLFGNVACQSYAIRSSASGDFLKNAKSVNYKLVSVKEVEGDPFDNKTHDRLDNGTEYADVDDIRRACIENTFQEEAKKVFGAQNAGGNELAVEMKINRRVLCSQDDVVVSVGLHHHRRTTIKNYVQIGNILLELKGKDKNGAEVFNVVVDYDMSSKTSGSVKVLVCDSFDKISKIINEKVLPLAVKEIGQNRVIDK